MPLSVRLPPRVEEQLAEYCVSHRISKSEAIKRALQRLLEPNPGNRSPYEIGKAFFEKHRGTPATEDLARHTKRLLREHFRGRRK